MAGIGFELQKMIRADRLSTNLQGFLHATVIAAGPWLLTCFALALMQSLARGIADSTALLRFNNTAVLAFSISLVAAGPYVLVVSRCLADAIYAKDVGDVQAMLFATLARVFMWLVPIGALVFGVLVQSPAVDRALGFLLLLACGGVWVAAGMMSALRSHATVTFAFAAGVTIALVVATAAPQAWREAGPLAGLVLGQATIFFVLAARLLAEFPSRDAAADDGVSTPTPLASSSPVRSKPFDIGQAMDRFRHLAWAGLFYNAALWVDKWMMWIAPGAQRAERGVWSHPTYEGAMFLAFLSIVPVMAIFLVDVETRFHHAYQRYFRGIDRRATLRVIRSNHGAILRITGSSFSRLALVQATIAVVAILASPTVVGWVGGDDAMAAVFRLGVFGAAFHVLLIITMAALAYFDQRRWLMAVAATFFVLNTVFTPLSIALGSGFHGWGYAAATMMAFALGYYAAARAIAKLPYMTFIGTNTSVREQRKPPDVADAQAAPRAASVLSGGATTQSV